MRRLPFLALAILGLAPMARAQLGALTGFCEQGGVSATVQGLPSTNKLQGVVPSCTVTVYLTGTLTKATLYSDAISTPLSNPFTGVALGGVAPGQWIFYAAPNTTYDIVLSGGIPPNVYSQPVTIKSIPIGLGAGGGSSPPIYSVQFASSSTGLFGSDPNITINPTTHTFTVGGSGTGVIGLCGATSGNCVNQTASPSTAGMYVQWPAVVPQTPSDCLTGTITGTEGGLPLIVGQWSGNCGGSYPPGFQESLGASMGSSDLTFTLGTAGENGYTSGYLYIDSEWISYSSISGNTVTVTPVSATYPNGGRGWFGSVPASHSNGAIVWGGSVVLSSPTIPPSVAIVGNYLGGTQVIGFNSPLPPASNGQYSVVFNSGADETIIDRAGAIHQTSPTGTEGVVNFLNNGNEFAAPVYIGTTPIAPIRDSSYVLQANIQNQIIQPYGFTGGVAGPFSTVQAPTVGAPTIIPVFNSGSTTWTYECQGVDSDGNLFPGATASITNGAATLTYPQAQAVFCPFAAGAVSYNVYRTAGGPNVGLVGNIAQQFGNISDFGGTLNGASPSGTNADVPRLCNNTQNFCILSGTSGTPPVSCTSGRQGWEYHITAATSTPFVLHCTNGSSWTTAY